MKIVRSAGTNMKGAISSDRISKRIVSALTYLHWFCLTPSVICFCNREISVPNLFLALSVNKLIIEVFRDNSFIMNLGICGFFEKKSICISIIDRVMSKIDPLSSVTDMDNTWNIRFRLSSAILSYSRCVL